MGKLVPQFKDQLRFWEERKEFDRDLRNHSELEVPIETTIGNMKSFVDAFNALEKYHDID